MRARPAPDRAYRRARAGSRARGEERRRRPCTGARRARGGAGCRPASGATGRAERASRGRPLRRRIASSAPTSAGRERSRPPAGNEPCASGFPAASSSATRPGSPWIPTWTERDPWTICASTSKPSPVRTRRLRTARVPGYASVNGPWNVCSPMRATLPVTRSWGDSMITPRTSSPKPKNGEACSPSMRDAAPCTRTCAVPTFASSTSTAESASPRHVVVAWNPEAAGHTAVSSSTPSTTPARWTPRAPSQS